MATAIASAIASELVPHVMSLAGDVKYGLSYGVNQYKNRDLYSITDRGQRVGELVKRVRSGQFQPTVVSGDE